MLISSWIHSRAVDGPRSDLACRERWLGRGPAEGSHRRFHHPTKPGTVTIAGKQSLDPRARRSLRTSDMSHFDRIHVQGFRRLVDLDLELRPLNVLIGANGSGKTSSLDVFALLAAS